ncbi:FxLYD domain-containing protein [Aureimonas psammosilenae]|uniref:FxLYD domain-containing protein n=1 Tax=Aureimonas psammosilenae TaxID=2495496 RepID=UPI001260B8D0|nr:FxLYD domain-containing protein [Aureimonas psammosilenae]
MRHPPMSAVTARRLLTVASVSMLALALSAPVRAEGDADLDLKPADFSPDETVAIRVDDLHPGETGTEIAVTVANRTDHAVTASVECSLFDAERESLGTATGRTAAIGAGESASLVVIAEADGAKRAYCQVHRTP